MIITIDEYKITPYHKSTQNEATLIELIPDIEREYLSIRKIPFIKISGDLVSESNVISDISSFNDLEVGQRLYGTNIRGYITSVNESNDDILCSKDALATENDASITVYPVGAKLTAAAMINFRMENPDSANMKSEKIGDYAYQAFGKDEMVNGYPISIVKSIKIFMGSKD